MLTFYHLLIVGSVFLAIHNELTPMQKYLKNLFLSLVDDQLRIRVQITSLPVELKTMLEKYMFQEEIEAAPSRISKRYQPCYK